MAVGVLSAFLLAGLAPLVVGQPDDRMAEPSKPHPSTPHRSRDVAGRPAWTGATTFALALTGTGVDKDNHTYRVVIDGNGTGKTHRSAANVTAFRGSGTVRIVVMDENGTVVKERLLRVRVRAHEAADGEIRWSLEGAGRLGHAWPKLSLHGNASQLAPGTFELEGHGRAHFAKTTLGHPLGLKLDVLGTLTRLA